MLSKEEEEAIKRLEKRIKDNENYTLTQVWLTDDVVATNIVLKLITKLQKENEDLKKENKELNEELNKENNRCMILANNDKFKEQVIDLMAEKIELLNNDFDDFCIYEICDEDCKNCIKKYFEKLVKEKQE